MNFLVIGHSVIDKIIDKGEISIKPGGIFYTVVSFLSQMNSEDKLYLCSSITRNNESLFRIAYDNVENDFLSYTRSIPTVELTLIESGERMEIYSSLNENLSLQAVNYKRFDGVLINMISGYDISLDQLIQLRNDYNGLIYLDVHTLSRGINKNLDRVFRRIKDFDKWARCIDILQANESELLTLSDRKDEATIIEELLSYSIKQIIITRAGKGATVYILEKDSVKKYHKNALQINTKNRIGCGDVFGAAYFYNYIKNKNVILALEQANLFAGIATTYSEPKDYLKLKKDASERLSEK